MREITDGLVFDLIALSTPLKLSLHGIIVVHLATSVFILDIDSFRNVAQPHSSSIPGIWHYACRPYSLGRVWIVFQFVGRFVRLGITNARLVFVVNGVEFQGCRIPGSGLEVGLLYLLDVFIPRLLPVVTVVNKDLIAFFNLLGCDQVKH